MESRVANYLNGLRIPMSGAAAKFKGDVTVDFVNNPGKYIIECKLSDDLSQGEVGGVPRLRLTLKWFPKIQQEALAMNARFGVLIIHYHGIPTDYVFIRSDHLNWVSTKSARSSILESIIEERIPAADIMRFADGKLRSSYGIEQRFIERGFKEVYGYKTMTVLLPDGTYYIFTLQHFRELMEGV